MYLTLMPYVSNCNRREHKFLSNSLRSNDINVYRYETTDHLCNQNMICVFFFAVDGISTKSFCETALSTPHCYMCLTRLASCVLYYNRYLFIGCTASRSFVTMDIKHLHTSKNKNCFLIIVFKFTAKPHMHERLMIAMVVSLPFLKCSFSYLPKSPEHFCLDS